MNTTKKTSQHDSSKTGSLLGSFVQETDDYFRAQIDQETYAKVMDSEDSRAHPYVAARIMLNNEQWEQYLWISHHGSLTGYSNNKED